MTDGPSVQAWMNCVLHDLNDELKSFKRLNEWVNRIFDGYFTL